MINVLLFVTKEDTHYYIQQHTVYYADDINIFSFIIVDNSLTLNMDVINNRGSEAALVNSK
jgi:hypothetical protein